MLPLVNSNVPLHNDPFYVIKKWASSHKAKHPPKLGNEWEGSQVTN